MGESQSMTPITCRIWVLVLSMISIIFSSAEAAHDNDTPQTFKIGILAYKGKASAIQRWEAHGHYLSQRLAPWTFEIIPLTYSDDELTRAVVEHQVDFVITNPGHYTELELNGHLSRLATLRLLGPQGILDQFGGTVIALPNRSDLNSYADLAGKQILIPSRSSLGGWQAHLREAVHQGVDLRRDATIIELDDHRKVVEAIFAGEGDAGFVRSGLIEELAAQGKLQLDMLKVVNKSPTFGSPYLVSTRLYPEWPFARVANTPTDVAEHVLQALLAMTPDDEAAIRSGIHGWTIPGHYSSVVDMFRETGLGPFAQQSLTLEAIFNKYWKELTLLVLLITGILLLNIARTMRANRVLRIEIGERTLTEAKLIESERYNRMLFETSPVGLALCSMDGVLVEINKVCANIIGHSIEEAKQLSYWDITPEEYTDDEYKQLESLNNTGHYGPYEKEYFHKDGHRVAVRLVGHIIERNGEQYIWSGVEDITVEKALKEKLGQSAAVVHNTAEGIIITDIDSRIISVNPAFTEITGYSEDEVIGQTPRILKSNKHDRVFYADMWKQVMQTGCWQGELWDRKKDGAVFPSWTTISAVINDDTEVTHYVGVFSDISSLKQSEDKLDFLAYHDPLTGLPNRLLMSDRLEHALRIAERKKKMLGVLFLDLDRFKNINDSLGHSVGDRLLEQVAVRLQEAVRQEDTVARLGGDEFVVLIEGVNHASDVIGLANKLLSSFTDSFSLNGHTLYVTPSIGVSVYPQDGSDPETLIRNADTAMYRAKEMGKNNCYLYSSKLTEQAMERLTLESALRNAIHRDEFELNYQPQVELTSNRLLGVEAMIRWNHPELGQILPDRFIPVAEESGLIIEIGMWVLKTACEQMQAWQQQGLALSVIAVNVSGIQFQRGDIVNTVASILSASGLPPQYLELEITESIILKRPEFAIDALHKLTQLGVSISIDDFGTGYSSLSQLKHLPVDKLKIDQSFVQDIPHDKDDEAIACAIIALGQSMNLKVIAEGIETVAQREFLISQGCNEGQGYLYSCPVPAARIEKSINTGFIT